MNLAIADYLMEVVNYVGDLATAAGLRSPGGLAIQLRLLLAGTMSIARAFGAPYGITEAVTADRVLIEPPTDLGRWRPPYHPVRWRNPWSTNTATSRT